MLNGKTQDGKGTKNKIAPKGSNKKIIVDNNRFDRFTSQKYQ